MSCDPNETPRRFRRLGIGVSAFFGVLAIVLCVLWVRSYDRLYRIGGPFGTSQEWAVGCKRGEIGVTVLASRTPSDFYYASNSLLDRFDISMMPRMHQAKGFGLKWANSQLLIVTPLLCPAIFAASLAVVSWHMAPMQFSLRALLIATTLVAVVLGLIGYTFR
jgi:hypothetical protein